MQTKDEQIAALLAVIEAGRAAVDFMAADEADSSATNRTRWARIRHVMEALHGVGNIEARRALGFLPPGSEIALPE